MLPGKTEEIKFDKKARQRCQIQRYKKDHHLKCMYTNIRSILNRNKKEELMGILTENKIYWE